MTPTDGRPAAELWFGAHPGDPSPGARATTLDRGARRRAASAALPFLVKILAAERALSIQVHPTRAQAEAGYDREEAAGIPLDARERNYVDRNHKPELLCALTPFEGLCGFRPVDRDARAARRARRCPNSISSPTCCAARTGCARRSPPS